MRLRLILSFALVVLVAIAAVFLLVRSSITREVGNYLTRSVMGLDVLASDLETYYSMFGTWEGADTLLAQAPGVHGRGRGMMGGMMGEINLRLADVNGNVVATDGAAPSPDQRLSAGERSAAIPLRGSNGEVIGYLVAEGGSMMMAQSNEQLLLDRLQRAALIAAGAAGGLALLLALYLSYRLLQPVEALTHAASGMAAGDFKPARAGARQGRAGNTGICLQWDGRIAPAG